MANPRHPFILQAETRARLKKAGKLPAEPQPAAQSPAAPPPPPPAAAAAPSAPAELSAREKLEALPDEELKERAEKLLLDPDQDREALIDALLKGA